MTSLLAQVRIPYESGTPEDLAVNTFSFITQGKGDLVLTTIAERLQGFYNNQYVSGQASVAGHLSDVLAPANAVVRIYDRADAQPRTPVIEIPIPLTNPESAGLPEEVALCLSFAGAPQSGAVAARRRGRVYIGPLALFARAQDGLNRVRPSTGCWECAEDRLDGRRDLGGALDGQQRRRDHHSRLGRQRL